jgi:imidazolonepropionase-like amidohydrolase
MSRATLWIKRRLFGIEHHSVSARTTLRARVVPCVAIAALLHASLTVEACGAQSTAFAHVTVVDVRAGQLRADQTVVVSGDRITAMGKSGTITIPTAATIVPGTGKYLMPGLIDAHVHLIDAERQGRMLVANGVVAVRDMGSPIDETLDYRNAILSGKQVGPAIVMAGMLAGGPTAPLWAYNPKAALEAREAVRSLKRRGVDEVKLYDGLSREAYSAAAEEAHALGMKAVGHVPFGLDAAMAVGQASVEHLRGLADALVPKAPSVDEFTLVFGPWQVFDQVPLVDRRALYVRLREHNVVMCPTLVYYEGIARAGEENMWADSLLQYSPSARPLNWESWTSGLSADVAKTTRPYMRILGQATRVLMIEGVVVVAGTDFGGPFAFAGFSLHRELQLFSDAGIAPADVLRSATLSAAALLDVEHDLGEIAVGRKASLLLLDADPLEQISNTRRIAGVMLNGRYLDRGKLDALLRQSRRVDPPPDVRGH